MKIIKHKTFIYFNLRFKNIHFLFLLFLFLILIKGLLLEFFDSFEIHMLNEEASLIDISDYQNIFPIITTDGRIYIGIPPKEKNRTTSNIIKISSALTFNNNFILMACTQYYLLSKINIETGEEIPLIYYGDFQISNCTCSISAKDFYVYIGITHIITPIIKIRKWRKDNFSDENENENGINSILIDIYTSDINNSITNDNIDSNINNSIISDNYSSVINNSILTEKIYFENNSIFTENKDFSTISLENFIFENNSTFYDNFTSDIFNSFLIDTTYNPEINNSVFSKLSDINNEEEYYIYYDYNNTYMKYTLIKIKLKNIEDNSGPILDNNFFILNYTLEFKHTKLDIMPFSRFLSCEVINIENSEESRLVCGYAILNKTDENKYSYLLCVTVMNSDFNEIENEYILYSLPNIPYIRLQRIDSYSIIYLFSNYSYIITLKLVESKCIIEISSNQYFHEFESSKDLFFYNNQHLFASNSTSMFIKKGITNNYMRFIENIIIQKIIGYYKAEGDILIVIYEYSINKIKYFSIENISPKYLLKANPKIINVKSNTLTTFNVGELISNSSEKDLLSLYYLTYFINTNNYLKVYDRYSFDKNSQILTVEPSLNDWISFIFYYERNINGIFASFILENATITIKTCLFKCGSCNNSFSECDPGSCKSKFALFEDDFERGCISEEQNFPNYIYNQTNNLFKKCFHSCKFCSLIGELSSEFLQNCIVCKEGYLRSYIFPGNCYKIEFPQNFSNISKVINNIDDENFEVVDLCTGSKKYKINETGECVDSCPLTTVYYTYYKNESVNISLQEESFIGLLYSLTEEKPPKYLFNKECYSTCPKLTHEDKNNGFTCKCSYAWHRDDITGEVICYDHKNYCFSQEYYYHTDDKECVLNGCKDDYYQINFECYKDKCPENTRLISSDIKKCESNLKYCYIDEHFQTKCSNTSKEGYNLNYDKTNIYFQSCDDSIFYFNEKTYLYMNTCYKNCPEETTKNDTNDRCSCNYYIYYLNAERTDYKCLNETEKCWDKKRYNITDKKECVNTRNECIENNYKVFNDECLDECPDNSESNEGEGEFDRGICLCMYNYYNDSNFLKCFENGKSCEEEGFPIKMNNTKECFLNKYECIKRGFKFYNNICYENSCPKESIITIEKNNDGMCLCQFYFFNNSNILTCFEEGMTCETQNYSYTYIDIKECFTSIDSCKERGLKIFNNNCYNKCPKNTKPKNEESFCICSYYFHRDEKNILNCFDSDKTCETEDFFYTNIETKECFRTKEECINKGYKVFNKECYNNCPNNTEDKNNDNICICSGYSFIDENNLIKCFESESECSSQEYYFNKEKKECFISKEICILNNKKIFGKECLDFCPPNSEIKQNPNLCECSYNYYDNSGVLICFPEEKSCESEGYKIKSSNNKECFQSINDCLSKNYSYYYDKTCFKNNCPSDKIPLKVLDDENKTKIINELNLDEFLSEKLCICDTENIYQGWIIEDSESPIQKCLVNCPLDYDLDPITHKCYYFCDPQKDYTFNNLCYKNKCPEGTFVKDTQSNLKECICIDIIEIDEDNGLAKCIEKIPEVFYEDRNNCPFIYKNKCYLKCPEDTCLTTKTSELFKCIDILPNMKIYNGICIEGLNEYAKNLASIENDDNIQPVITPSGVIINAFSSEESIEKLISKNPNVTYVDLGECKDRLRDTYKFDNNLKLYIIGIDVPDISGNSSINIFNFEVYLKNGTKIEDLSSCYDVKITISSKINDLEIINFNKAINFYEKGYDIYNSSDVFYIDHCSPAQDKGNDITLKDRYKYYYPNVSICNDGCTYDIVDFQNHRFICNCNTNLNINDTNDKEKKLDEKNEAYTDYFLSLLNYKIFICLNIFLEFKSFYSNAGFYISFTTLIFCMLLSFIFWKYGLKHIRIIMYENIPTKEKLNELIKRQIEKNKYKNTNDGNDENDDNNENTFENNNKEIEDNKVPINIHITNDHLENNNDIPNNINFDDSPNLNNKNIKKSLFLNDLGFEKK